MAVDISNLPAPPSASSSGGPDISSLPAPPKAAQTAQAADISDLPPPPPPAGPKNDKYLLPEDVDAIAQKHGIDPEKLRKYAPYFANTIPADTSASGYAQNTAKEAVNALGEMSFNIPQFLIKEAQQDPKLRAALDDLHEAGSNQQSIPEKIGTTIAAPLPALGELKGAGLLTKMARGAAEGAGIGAVGSTLESREGQEASSALHGAVLGAGLGAAGGVLGKFLEKGEGREQGPANKDIDIQKGVGELADRTEKSEAVIQDTILGDRTSLSRDDIEDIIHEQVPESRLEEYMSASTPEGMEVRSKIGQAEHPTGHDLPDQIKRELADDILTQRTQDFSEFLTGNKPKNLEEATNAIQERLSKEPEYVQSKYENFADEQLANRHLNETGNRSTTQPGFYSQQVNKLLDSQYVFRSIDNRNGTTLEPLLREGNKDYNKSTFALKDYRTKLGEVFQEANKLGTSQELRSGGRIYAALENPELLTQLSPQEKKSADSIRKFLEDAHKFQTKGVAEKDIAPLGTAKVENYVPHIAKPLPEIVPIIEQKWDQALAQLSSDTGRDIKSVADLSLPEFRKASEGPLKDLNDFVSWGNGRTPQTGADLNRALNDALYSRKGKEALEVVARSSLSRTGEIPDFLLEKNLFKIMDMYSANTIRGMYLRKFIDGLESQASILDKAGADVDAKYVRTLGQDILGTRQGTAGSANRAFKTGYYRQLDNLIDKAGGPETFIGARLTVAKAMPDILRELALQIYPASMGLNLRSAVQNLTGSITKLAPEMGGVYGYRTLARAAMEAIPNFRSELAKVRSTGNLPAGFIREGEEAIAEGLQATMAYRIPRKAVQGLSNGMMIMHQLSENTNRILAQKAGEIMGREILQGSSAARNALERFPRSIQREVAENPNGAGKILGQYLNDTTSYNYNRLSMNQFGRTMGPLFSVFTKWPAATAGDILATMSEKGAFTGAYRVLEKYVAPALLLHLMTVGMTGGKQKDLSGDDISDRQKLVSGSHGFVQGAPIGNILSLAKGEVGIPPVAAIGYHALLKPALEGHAPSARAFAAQMTQSFAPGVGLLRFLTQDLVTGLVTGRKPGGADFFEKTSNGFRKLTK